MSDQWMSIVEYARAFSISDMTVRRRIKNGKLDAVLKDGKYYINVSGAEASGPISMPKPADIPVVDSPKGQGAISSLALAREGLRDSWQAKSSGGSSQSGTEGGADQLSSMLSYCERSLNRINSIERHLQESYTHKFAFLNAEIKRKDQEISQLKQQVEDLKILVKMYDANG